MTAGWIIDAGIFEDFEEMAEAVTRQGHVVKLTNRPNPPYQWADTDFSYRNCYSEGACVIVHADIDTVCRVEEDKLWTPGTFGTIANYFCSNYYAHLGSFLLNNDYIMLPFAELPRCHEFLFRALGNNGRLFVRPDSPLKIFSGLTIGKESLEQDFEFMGFYDFPKESLIVVSSPKKIVAEWRFLIANGKVVTGSQYVDHGEQVALAAIDPNALRLAQEVVTIGYEPDPVWILGICKTAEGDYRVLEIGGFSFASLYGCDKDKVVKAVSEVAIALHQQQ